MMAEMSPGTALRQLRQAHAGLKKARQLLKQARATPGIESKALDFGWESLTQAHRLMAAVPRAAVDDAVMTQQLSVQRYATALLVRLRRIIRHDTIEGENDETDLDDDLE